jgi:hypothetical protein
MTTLNKKVQTCKKINHNVADTLAKINWVYGILYFIKLYNLKVSGVMTYKNQWYIYRNHKKIVFHSA